MKNRMSLFSVAATVLVLPLFLGGCEREVSHTGSASVNRDGSAKSQETVVRQAPDGTVTKEETYKKTDSDGDATSKTKTTVKSPDGTVTKDETESTTQSN